MPSGNWSAASSASSTANLVLPQPPTPADRGADVVAFIAQLRFTRVDGHAGAHLGVARPLLHRHRALQCERERHRILRARERNDKAVAFALLDWPGAIVTFGQLV